MSRQVKASLGESRQVDDDGKSWNAGQGKASQGKSRQVGRATGNLGPQGKARQGKERIGKASLGK